MQEYKMDALVAELQPIKHWDAGETPASEGEIESATDIGLTTS